MTQTWAYLKPEEYKQYKQRAETLGMTEGELTQYLIRLFLNIPEGSYQPTNCINCQYYRVATSTARQALMKINEAFTLVIPEYKRRAKG